MAMKTGAAAKSTLSEINVTPLVDVMLVLLIIFMVTTPMMNQGIPIQLPQTSRQANLSLNLQEASIVTVAENGVVYIDERRIPQERLEIILTRLYDELSAKDVYLRGDRRVPYGEVVKVLSTMKKVGISRVGMVTEVYEVP